MLMSVKNAGRGPVLRTRDCHAAVVLANISLVYHL
jgi:hypothetical protein